MDTVKKTLGFVEIARLKIYQHSRFGVSLGYFKAGNISRHMGAYILYHDVVLLRLF